MKIFFAFVLSFFTAAPAFAIGDWCRNQPYNQQENCYAVTARQWNRERAILFKKIVKYRPDLKEQLWRKEEIFEQVVDTSCQTNKCVSDTLERNLLELRVFVRELGLTYKE